ncbi:MAG: T9SS type A sorting domain-containing protein, partial [Bacteroidales bacterium]|nr:T9SS type A sorting domain-containing protein [Bacteroidales bacterium]
ITSETVSNFVGGMNIYLEDIKTGGFKQLYKGTQHSFSYDPLDEEHRFNLHFTTEHLGTGETAISGLDIYSFGQIVYVKNPELIQGDIAIYDVIGQIITTTKTGSTLTEIPITKGSGYYFVKVQTDTAIITEKVFIR